MWGNTAHNLFALKMARVPKKFQSHKYERLNRALIITQNTEGDTQKTAVLVLFSQAIPKEDNMNKRLIINGYYHTTYGSYVNWIAT